MFKGKATNNDDTFEALGVKENDFLVVMTVVKVYLSLSKKPEPKKQEEKQEENLQQKETSK